MRVTAHDGLWRLGPAVPAPPAVAVLEISGAVLAWTVDDPAAPVQITFTDIAAADWLWRVVGVAGHLQFSVGERDEHTGHVTERVFALSQF